MVVILAGGWIVLPRRSAKCRNPIIGRLLRPFAVAPDVPIALRRSARRFRFQEPLVLIRCMVWHKIQDDLDSVRLRFSNQPVEIRQRAVHRIDVFVVAHVVSKIDLRRREARRDPDGIDAKMLQVAELRGDPLQIADAIIIAVGETPRINLVENRVVPPLVAFRVNLLQLPASEGRKRAHSGHQQADNDRYLGHEAASRCPTRRCRNYLDARQRFVLFSLNSILFSAGLFP